jgi:hypothetical protein
MTNPDTLTIGPTLCTDPCLGLASSVSICPNPQILVSSFSVRKIPVRFVAVDWFQELYKAHWPLRKPPSNSFAPCASRMTDRSSGGDDIISSALPSLPPRPSEILPEHVSSGNQSMIARPAEASGHLRVNPLIDAAPSCGTTFNDKYKSFRRFKVSEES